MQMKLYIAAMVLPSLVFVSIFSLTSDSKSATIKPEQMADCIAEQAYTNPKSDRYAELVNAVKLCQDAKNTVTQARECIAPCTVILPPDTLEDEFGINYGWRNSDTPIVDVYTRKGGE